MLRIIFICVAWASAACADEPSLATNTFATSDRCIACHSGLHTRAGEDVSIGHDWRATMMANSARDPYWQAAVRREVSDHPIARAAIEDKCATCHMPAARFDAASRGEAGAVFASLDYGALARREALDGVTCTVCHQISPANLGTHASFDGGFEIAPAPSADSRMIYGPHSVDSAHESVMRSAARFTPRQSTHMQQSELCATCHTLYTTALDETGATIGDLPEQVPYQEWLHSDYRETRSCQSCHMPEVAEETPISSVLGQPRPRLSQHTFRGGNAFVLALLGKYRDELGTTAAPNEMDAAVRETKEYLGSAAARLTIESAAIRDGRLDLALTVESATGHKLPTAYPSRRVWLHVRVSDEAGRVLFESGAPQPDGSIAGNDNDEDPLEFEPHYARIESQGQVQIYESVMVDRDGHVTTGLLRGVRYAKDNRLLPKGFDKSSAAADIAVHGEAATDVDFVGGSDRVAYRVSFGGARPDYVDVDATLLYQSIGYRWAANLAAYEGAEPQRFARYYADTAGDFALPLASARMRVAAR